MKIGFYLAHPAHFHLFKNVILSLRRRHNVFIAYNQKDVLTKLIKSSDLGEYAYEIKTPVAKGKLSLLIQFVLKIIGAFRLFRKLKPDIVLGTPILVSIVGRYLKYKSIIVNEDDFDIVWKTVKLGYPKADHILCPSVCRTLNFTNKSVKYEGYHELAYLHPRYFTPDISIKKKYLPGDGKYFLIRFAKLTAHHDVGIKGINDQLALDIIDILKPTGNIYITSERELIPELEKYRLNIDPLDIHHVMAFASLYIGDSQTMAAEAGVLGVPFIRYNDFVGRLSYLDELENKYKLGIGITTEKPEILLKKVVEIIETENIMDHWKKKKEKMLADKIDVTEFFIWFIENYPESVNNHKHYMYAGK